MKPTRQIADVLEQAYRTHGGPARVAPAAPPEDEPKPNSPEDVGFVHVCARPRPAVVEAPALVLAFVRQYADTWEAVLRRPDGKELAVYAPNEREVRAKAAAEIRKAGVR